MNRNRHRPGYLPAKMLQRSECCGDVRLHTKQNNNNNQTVGEEVWMSLNTTNDSTRVAVTIAALSYLI